VVTCNQDNQDLKVRGAILCGLHDVMYMSMNHNENVETFKQCARRKVKQFFNQYSPSDAFTSFFGPIIGNLVCDHFQFIMFDHPFVFFPFVLELLLSGHI
jgi:hypothetical protein